MPRKPDRPCRHPGCAELSDGAYCKAHRPQYTRRESAYARGYDAKWQHARKRFLLHNPLCVICRRDGRLVPAAVVDHIIPHRGDESLFWDRTNWQPLCKPCHDRKTGRGE